MKYFGPILIAVSAALVCAFLLSRNNATLSDYKRYNDSLNQQINLLNDRFDSLSNVERTQITKKTIINNHYDSTKTVIYYLSDSANFNLLRANINRYEYLYQPSSGKGN